MMKRCKQIAVSLLCAVLLALCLPAEAMAAGSIDLGREVSLCISCQEDGQPLAGAEWAVYLVATAAETGELTTTEAFRQFPVNMRGENDQAWKTLASTLEGYVLRDGIAPADSGVSDEQGLMQFPTGASRLTPGLYLVLGQRHTQDGRRYDPSPFMVLLPTQDKQANVWDYAVNVNAKYEGSDIPEDPAQTVSRKVLKVWQDEGQETARPQEVVVQLLRNGSVYDTVTLNAQNNWRFRWTGLPADAVWTVAEKECENYTVEVSREGATFVVTNTCAQDFPDETPPATPTLPQTGQLWWPVPVLLSAGLLCVVLGLLRRRREER